MRENLAASQYVGLALGAVWHMQIHTDSRGESLNDYTWVQDCHILILFSHNKVSEHGLDPGEVNTKE